VNFHESSDLSIGKLGLSDELTEPSPPSSSGYNVGIYSIGQGIRFLLFFALSLLAFGFILAAEGLYVAALILFLFVELPILFKNSKRHWRELNSFSGKFFTRMFGFIKGLWE
jgi:hypothetical protein